MKTQLRLIALAAYIVAASAAMMLPRSAAADPSASLCTGSCFSDFMECVNNNPGCGGGTAWSCVTNHWCCDDGAYGFCA